MKTAEEKRRLRTFVLRFGAAEKNSEERNAVVDAAVQDVAPFHARGDEALTREQVAQFLRDEHRRAELAVLFKFLKLAVEQPSAFIQRFRLERIPPDKLPCFVCINAQGRVSYARSERAAEQPGRSVMFRLSANDQGYRVTPAGGVTGYAVRRITESTWTYEGDNYRPLVKGA